jgi:hypothetical protein
MTKNSNRKFVRLTDANVDTIELQDAVGIYQNAKIQEFSFVYRLTDLYMIIGWIHNCIFYCDENEIGSSRLDATAFSLVGVRQIKSVGFGFGYSKLPMETIETQWQAIEKLLKSKKSDNLKRAVVSIAILTSESWRFHAIANACKRHRYSSLKLSYLVWDYIDEPSEAVKSFNYTLRDSVNNWGDLSDSKRIKVEGKCIPFTEQDIRKILKREKTE